MNNNYNNYNYNNYNNNNNNNNNTLSASETLFFEFYMLF